MLKRSAPVSLSSSSTKPLRAPRRSGPLQTLLNWTLQSPIWKYVLVPQARKKMEDTAMENGIPWVQCRGWLESQDGPWKHLRTTTDTEMDVVSTNSFPDWYRQSFHAYEKGNLCWEAALEVEIASRAVGARNFPAFGSQGETAFRDAFQIALSEGGARCPPQGVILDMGCGTGISTRRLATEHPQASIIRGVDLSPNYIRVGTFLLENAPIACLEHGGPWVNSIERDPRIQLTLGNAAETDLPDNSVDVVNLQFVAHELPYTVTLNIIKEARRILKPGGQMWFSEMDFETPGYAAQRANPLLFSLIRATEPWLDDYADHQFEMRECLKQSFASTVITPATGRHFAIVSTKDDSIAEHVLIDNRFDENGIYRVADTHLKTFENRL